MKNTTLVYIEKEGCYLMLLRNKKENDLNEGKWIGVGGHFEENESPEECMIREVFEETNLRVTDYRYRAVVTFVSDRYEGEYMHLFTVSSFEGELKECNEGELRWILKEEVFGLNLWVGDRTFLKYLLEDRGFFTMKLTYVGDDLIDIQSHMYDEEIGERKAEE